MKSTTSKTFLIFLIGYHHQFAVAETASLQEKVYSMRCERQGIIEVESKETGQKKQVEKESKITIGTRLLSPSRSYMDAEVYFAGQKAYRFTVDKRTEKIEETDKIKKIHFDCKGVRYDLDGSVHQFCGPWIEVFEKGAYGMETFKGYEENGMIDSREEIRSRSEFPDGSIIESLVNIVPRVSFESESEIWRIYREHQNCLMTPLDE